MELIIRVLKNLFYIYYRDFMGPPYRLFKGILPEEYINDYTEPAFKLTVTVIILLIARSIYLRAGAAMLKHRLNKSMTGHDVREPYTTRDTSFVEELDMVQHPVHTLDLLKKEKRYGRMAEIYAKLNEPTEAARWFIKDRQYQRAAEELAKAGKTGQAARMLLRVGDYPTAARFYITLGKHKKAASACLKGGDLPAAACAYAEGGFNQNAADTFKAYFTGTKAPLKDQEAAADQCYRLIQRNEFTSRLPIEERNELLKLVGERFLAAGRSALAATLFQESGDTKKASSVYKQSERAQIEKSEHTSPPRDRSE